MDNRGQLIAESATEPTSALERLYGKMVLIRRFEETLLGLFARGEIVGTTHTCIGQEANAVGVVPGSTRA